MLLYEPWEVCAEQKWMKENNGFSNPWPSWVDFPGLMFQLLEMRKKELRRVGKKLTQLVKSLVCGFEFCNSQRVWWCVNGKHFIVFFISKYIKILFLILLHQKNSINLFKNIISIVSRLWCNILFKISFLFKNTLIFLFFILTHQNYYKILQNINYYF